MLYIALDTQKQKWPVSWQTYFDEELELTCVGNRPC